MGFQGKNYLEGAMPYNEDVVQEYTSKGLWLNKTYGDLLDRNVELYPDRAAVVDEMRNLIVTFRQLKEKTDRLAIAFLEMGIRKHDRILFQIPNRYEFLVAFLAAHRIGAIPVITIPRAGYLDISQFLKITKAVGWIIPLKNEKEEFLPLVDRIRSEAEEQLKHVIIVHDDDDESYLPKTELSIASLINSIDLNRYPADYLNQFKPHPDDVAFILTTGGTTGTPKCVPRTHNSYLAQIRFATEDATDSRVVGLFTPIGHGLALNGQVGMTCMWGATLVLGKGAGAQEILEAIDKWRITDIFLVPTQLEDIINYADLETYDISSLKRITSTGAPLSPQTADKVRRLLVDKTRARFVNLYGTSEGPSTRPPQPEVPLPDGAAGLCHPGTIWKAVNEGGQDLPTGAEGELVVKGPTIFSGYFGASKEENDALFTPDGYYKTGDIGRVDEYGFIYITGRKKEVIMRGGESIPAKGIEEVIEQLPMIEKAAVIGMPDPRLGERICAYVKCKPGINITLDEMIEQLIAKGLGKLHLPERLEIVSELPRTAIGKTDKKALQSDIRNKLKQEGVIV